MFRSGTTLVSKVLNAHDEIVSVPDMFTPFFNAFRDAVAKQIGVKTQPLEYLGDYFANEHQFSILNANLRASMDLSYNHSKEELLLTALQSRGRMTCPAIVKHLNRLEGATHKEVYKNLMQYILTCYGNGQEKLFGNKEVWVTEFIPTLAKAYPKAKFIVVNRDPRAVCASKNVASTKASAKIQHEKYPWLFLIRQWRKLAILAWLLKEDPDFRDRIFYLQYEDLLTNPEEIIRQMCDFLGIELDHKMLDPNCFKDGNGEKWLQNSSYNAIDKRDGFLVFKDNQAKFDNSKINKWKEVLTLKETEYIEQLCHTEMKLFGYDFVGTGEFGLNDELVLKPPLISPKELQPWIQPIYEQHTHTSNVNEMAKEKIRQQMLLLSNDLVQKIDPKVIKSYFIDNKYFKTAREVLQL